MNRKTVFLWILTAIFAVLAIIFITGPTGVLFLLAAVMTVPIPKLRYWIDELVAKYGKLILTVILVVAAVVLVPRPETDDNGGLVQSGNSNGQTQAPEFTDPTGQTQPSQGETQRQTEPNSTDSTVQVPTDATDVTQQPTDATQAPTQAPTVATQAPTEATAAPTEENLSDITFLSWPERIVRGTEGTVTIKGAPNTTYSIKVYYKSGPSAASGLEDKVSDAEGYVTWTWKVSSRTGTGTFKIVVTGGGESAQVEYSVVDK